MHWMRLLWVVLAGSAFTAGESWMVAESLEDHTGQPFVNSVGMRLAPIPAGTFLMGSPPDEPMRQEEERRHQVQLTRPYHISITEVTQTQWLAVMGSNRSQFRGDDRSVEKVSWKDAMEFCQKLSGREGRTYRLPTEAEWEYACRAGGAGAFAGTGVIDDMAWYEGNAEGESHPVAAKKPNAWGLFDMHGNVAEWCNDRYGPYTDAPVVDPAGPAEGNSRVIRGGSWSHFPAAHRCAARTCAPESHQYSHLGFRVVLETSR